MLVIRVVGDFLPLAVLPQVNVIASERMSHAANNNMPNVFTDPSVHKWRADGVADTEARTVVRMRLVVISMSFVSSSLVACFHATSDELNEK